MKPSIACWAGLLLILSGCHVTTGTGTGTHTHSTRTKEIHHVPQKQVVVVEKPAPAPDPVSYRAESTTVTVNQTFRVFGTFDATLRPADVAFHFKGVSKWINATHVSRTEVRVEVPKKAITGKVELSIRGSVVWVIRIIITPKAEESSPAPSATYRLEPTVGPVGTTVTLYGTFPKNSKAKDFHFSFNGPKALFAAKSATSTQVSAVVPGRTVTGPLSVMYKKETLWQGVFRVIPDATIIKPTPAGKGLRGEIWKLPENTQNLPNFATLGTPFATITVPQIDVAPRRFETGFPGLEGNQDTLVEWFAIRFSGKIKIPNDGPWGFQTTSDDGVKVYIDGKLVLTEDGVHPPKDTQATVQLTKGFHDIVVEYFQGPKYHIALQLRWRKDGNNDKQKWQVIPAHAFVRD